MNDHSCTVSNVVTHIGATLHLMSRNCILNYNLSSPNSRQISENFIILSGFINIIDNSHVFALVLNPGKKRICFEARCWLNEHYTHLCIFFSRIANSLAYHSSCSCFCFFLLFFEMILFFTLCLRGQHPPGFKKTNRKSRFWTTHSNSQGFCFNSVAYNHDKGFEK